jgi:formylmethanofuran dehydrogenase subunit C
MNNLTFTLKQALPFTLNCATLTPDCLAEKSLAEIKALPLNYANQQVRADAIFDISGSDTQHLIFKNSSEKLHYLGANMGTGSMRIEGNAGAYLAYNMKAGRIDCHGNTDAYAACSMRGGLLQIHGNTGDFLGAGTEGSRKGMLGGTVIVKGNAGDRAGDQMRRGLILIEGNVGDYCASRMIAGTIGVLGELGAYTAFNMRRGTLLLKQAPKLHATMQNCGTHTLPFLSLLFKSFANYDTAFKHIHNNRVQRFVGDAATNGNGEILVLNP